MKNEIFWPCKGGAERRRELIKITFSSPSWEKPETRTVSEQNDPNRLFVNFVLAGQSWEVDYSRATRQERDLWARAELVAWLVRAEDEGKRVFFDGRELDWGDDGLQKLETALSCGQVIKIDREDEAGLWLLGLPKAGTE